MGSALAGVPQIAGAAATEMMTPAFSGLTSGLASAAPAAAGAAAPGMAAPAAGAPTLGLGDQIAQMVGTDKEDLRNKFAQMATPSGAPQFGQVSHQFGGNQPGVQLAQYMMSVLGKR